jgi:transcriptional regulator with XRE-family HTH domain
MFGLGLGKRRSRLGTWLDHRGITQQWLANKAGVGRNTISDLVSGDDRAPNARTMQKILNALRTVDPKLRLMISG